MTTAPVNQKKFSFSVTSKDLHSQARTGFVSTPHGDFETPVFMPVGTQAAVKALTNLELEDAGSKIILSNTYHLYIRPGIDIISRAGGLHRFMGWNKPILTDSGGFQVFSLSKVRQITEEGATFRSHFDGSEIFLSPEKVVEIQEVLGSDIAMIFDECPPPSYDREAMKRSLELTLRWSERAKKHHRLQSQALFGIVQGGSFKELRLESLERTVAIGFDGYALGGLCVGESREDTFDVYRAIAPKMPEDKPRYMMGVGTPIDFVMAVESGADMFDCVTPTRYGRTGTAFTDTGIMVVRNGKYTDDMRPIMENCGCYTCRNYSRAYLRHLFNTGEMTGSTLVSVHNVHFFVNFVTMLRESIRDGSFTQVKKDFLKNFDPNGR